MASVFEISWILGAAPWVITGDSNRAGVSLQTLALCYSALKEE